MDIEKRKKITREIPWVSELKKPVPCEGFRYSAMPLKAFHGTQEEQLAAREKYRCKKTASWNFRALKPRHEYDSRSQSGKYCWRHLFSIGFLGTQREEARLDKWMRRHHPELYSSE
jgi:hypothetical protein